MADVLDVLLTPWSVVGENVFDHVLTLFHVPGAEVDTVSSRTPILIFFY